MRCSLSSDPSGTTYIILDVTWNGIEKLFRLQPLDGGSREGLGGGAHGITEAREVELRAPLLADEMVSGMGRALAVRDGRGVEYGGSGMVRAGGFSESGAYTGPPAYEMAGGGYQSGGPGYQMGSGGYGGVYTERQGMGIGRGGGSVGYARSGSHEGARGSWGRDERERDRDREIMGRGEKDKKSKKNGGRDSHREREDGRGDKAREGKRKNSDEREHH